MYVLAQPASLPPPPVMSYPPPTGMFDLHSFPYPSSASYSAAALPYDLSSMYTQPPQSSNYDFSYSLLPSAGPAVSDYNTAAPYSVYPHSQSAACSPSSAAHPMPPADLISAFPSPASSPTPARQLGRYLDSEAPVSTVAALSLPGSRSSSLLPYSALHDRRSSSAVGTHAIDNQRPHSSTRSTAAVSPPSGPTSVPMTASASHPAFTGKVKEEYVEIRSLGSSLLLDVSPLSDLPELRVNVDMANYHSTDSADSSTSSPCTTSTDPSHSPISLPSFHASSYISSTPSSPIPADIEAMVNAIDFQFAAAEKLLRPIRHRKRRRKVAEINPLEVWRCQHAPCDKVYKRTSSVSINRHKEVCEYRPNATNGSASETVGGVKSKEKNTGIDVLQLIQQLLSGDENGQNPLGQLTSMASNGVSLEQLLTGALSEQLVKHITAQLAPTPVPAASVTKSNHASASVKRSTPTAARKRAHTSSTVSELPELMRASTTPATQPVSAPSTHKRIMITPPSEDLLGADTVPLMAEPSTPSPTGAAVHFHSPLSAPVSSSLPHPTHHARSYSASLGRQYPQLVKGSFLGNGAGLLSGLVGTMNSELGRMRGGINGADEKVDATTALSLKAAQVALAQRELVASLFGH